MLKNKHWKLWLTISTLIKSQFLEMKCVFNPFTTEARFYVLNAFVNVWYELKQVQQGSHGDQEMKFLDFFMTLHDNFLRIPWLCKLI